jgi:uncharacterized membrane protein
MDIGAGPHMCGVLFNVFIVCLNSLWWFMLWLVYIPYLVLVLMCDEKGSVESEIAKYGRESCGTRTRE